MNFDLNPVTRNAFGNCENGLPNVHLLFSCPGVIGPPRKAKSTPRAISDALEASFSPGMCLRKPLTVSYDDGRFDAENISGDAPLGKYTHFMWVC